ncbi:hypothetical protein [Actinophytocola sp.]|uniref:hypothetical protein n=1 Tax=Actinophytocola sp. TaxID=1872138 RepID=UPI002ED3B59F
MAEDEIGYYWYEGCPLEDKIAWMKEGEGSLALFEAQSALAQLGFDLVESERSLRDQVRLLGSSWEGTAGTAAGEAMMAAAKWSADSAPAADQAWSQVGLQSESVDRTKNGMPGAAPAPEYGFGDAFGDAVNMRTGNLFDVQTSFDDQVAQRRAADELANRLLYQHEAASRANLAAMPTLGEVPTITVQTEERSENPHLLEHEQVTENRPPNVGDEIGPEAPTKTDGTEKPTDRPTDKPTDKTENEVEGEPPRDGGAQDSNPQNQQAPRNSVPEQEQDGRQSLRPNDSVSAAGFVPDPDRPQTGQQPSYRGSAGGGVGSLGGGGFVGGFSGADSSRGPTRGPGALNPGPQTGAVPGRGGPAGAAARGGVSAGAGRGGSGLFGQPPTSDRSGDEEDGEHSDKYFRGTDELFRTDDIPALGHSVIGADETGQP